MIQGPKPQDFLDDLKAIGIPRLFQRHLTTRDRAAGIRRARQELGRIRAELTLQRQSPPAGAQAATEAELKRHAAPYNLLLLLHEQLVDEVNDLERSLSGGKPLPYSFDFGHFIFGDEVSGQWYVGSQEQYEDWLRIQQFKARLDALRQKGQPAREHIHDIRLNLEALAATHEKRQQQIDKRQENAFVYRRIALLVILLAISFTAGSYYFDVYRSLSLIALGLGAACAALIPIVILNWKDPRTRSARKQRQLEREMQALQQEGMQYRQKYQPLELQIKALEVHYSRMMETWETARRVKKRLDSFLEEGNPLRERVTVIREELEELRQRREAVQTKLDARQKRAALPRRMLLHLLLALASAALGIYLATMGESDYATILYGIGAFCVMLLPLAYFDWKRRNANLEAALRQIETRMLQLQTEGKQVMKRYHPIELQIKTLLAQYKRTRAGIIPLGAGMPED